MTRDELKKTIFVGVVEENDDPKRQGRVRVRVTNIFDEIPVEDIPWAKPWKDLNGNAFSIPDKGKVVSVVFDSGSIYRPEYIYAEHYNINLEEKLKALSKSDYPTFKATLFDHSTQIYRSKSEGLKMDHEYTNINLDKSGNINLNLRDNKSYVYVGTNKSDQEAVLGTHFMTWMDKFMDVMSATPYIGNLGAPVVASPALLAVAAEYRASKQPLFLSKHIWLVDNFAVTKQKRKYEDQAGDTWKSTVTPNELTKRNVPVPPDPNEPTDPNEEGKPSGADEIDNNDVSPGFFEPTIRNEQRIQTISVSNYQNGKIPLEKMVVNKNLASSLTGTSAYLMPEASAAFDSMMAAYNKSSFKGKQAVTFTSGYRTLEKQQELASGKYKDQAAKAGRSPHGWGLAVDFWWGVPTSLWKNQDARRAAFRHPVYKWFYENAPKFGWYNPKALRNDDGLDEWWHWEYHPEFKGKSHNEVQGQPQNYSAEFSQSDVELLRNNGATFKLKGNWA